MRSKWLFVLTPALCIGLGEPSAIRGQDSPDQPGGSGLPLPASLIALDSNVGQRLLWESKAKEDYIPLSIHFTTQKNLAYCGVATGAMILNGLAIPRPRSEAHAPYRLFTQENFFTPGVCRVVPPDEVDRSGMSLKQFADSLRAFPVDVVMTYASEGSLAEFRSSAIQTLRDRTSFLAINYLRSTLSQKSGGHISPVAAYHEGEDRFLILDVSRYKYPPVWVKAGALWDSMAVAADPSSRQSRGYLIVRAAPDSKKSPAPGEPPSQKTGVTP
jgi:Phytochelatin synthase